MTSKEYFKFLIYIHFAFNLGALVIAFFLYYTYLGNPADPNVAEDLSILTTLGIIIAFGGVFFSAYTYKSKTLGLREVKNLSEKLSEYKSVSIISWTILEFSTLINIVFFFLTGNELLFYIALFLIALMFLKRPTRSRCRDSLGLNKEETRTIMSPDSIVIE